MTLLLRRVMTAGAPPLMARLRMTPVEVAGDHLCPAARAVMVLASTRPVSVSGWP